MSRKGYPSDKQDQFMLRLPEGMRDQIKESAALAGRSMNAEIVARLQQSYEDIPAGLVKSSPETLDLIDMLIEAMEERKQKKGQEDPF